MILCKWCVFAVWRALSPFFRLVFWNFVRLLVWDYFHPFCDCDGHLVAFSIRKLTFFQFGEFVLNSFFASPSPLLSSLFFFSNPHYLDLLGYSSNFLTFSPLLIHLFVFLFYFFESFLQPSNYSTAIFIFSTICLISNTPFCSLNVIFL